MKRGALIGSIALILTLSAHQILAATIRVPADQPTIQAGIDAAVDGDLVLAAPGIYVENIDFLGKAIELRGKNGPARTIIDGAGAGSVVTFDSGESLDSVLAGFTIRNGDAEDGGGIHCYEASPTIRNCTIRDNRARDWGGGILCYSNASPSIRNCLLEGNVANMGGGICCRNASSPTITHCVISNNHSTNDGGGIQLWSSWPVIKNSLFHGNSAEYDGGGIHGWDGGSATVVNCTLSENRAVRQGGGIFGGSGGSFAHSTYSMTNCILWRNEASEGPEIALNYHGSTLDIRFSDVLGGEADVFVHPTCQLNWGPGNIDADPRFCGGGDFHLTSASPCIDAGIDACALTDLDGDPRPQGGGSDIGADEYAGPRWVLEMDVSCDEGILDLDFTLGTPEPARWWVLLFTTDPVVRPLVLFMVDLPVLDPPRHEVFSRAIPDIGTIGALTFLKSDEGVQVHDLEWIDTGG